MKKAYKDTRGKQSTQTTVETKRETSSEGRDIEKDKGAGRETEREIDNWA